MKKITLLLVVFVCILMPSVARADDGGFWDMLFHWDTKFSSYSVEFHLLCLDEAGKRIDGCEEWFSQLPHFFRPSKITHSFDFNEIKRGVDFRLSFMHSYGQRTPDTQLSANDAQTEAAKVYALKLMGFYRWYFNVKNMDVDYGVGAGAIPLFGSNVTTVWRGIITPVSITFAKPKTRWTFRLEGYYLTGTVTASDLGITSPYASKPKPGFAGTFGFDLRRIGSKRTP
jgi:hypothetical protein